MRAPLLASVVLLFGLLFIVPIEAQDAAKPAVEKGAAEKVVDETKAAKKEAEEKGEPTAAEKLLAEQRLKFMTSALDRYKIYVGQDRELAPLLPNPVLRWANPVSGVKDGIVGVYSSGGRPTAIVQFAFHGKAFQVHEFYSMTTDSFDMERNSSSVWKPAKPAFAFQDLKDGPKPAKTDRLRLPQMRQIASEFTVVDDFGWDKKEKQHLRLLSQPLLRYTDEERGVVDGALFTYSMGTNPEANLLLELVKSGDSLKWQFGFSPMTIYALTATYKESPVWEIGERKVFNSYDTPFRVGPYPAEPGEIVPE